MLLPSGFILSHHFFSHYMLFMDVIIPMPSAAMTDSSVGVPATDQRVSFAEPE